MNLTQAIVERLQAALQQQRLAEERAAWELVHKDLRQLQQHGRRLPPNSSAQAAISSLHGAYAAPPPPGDCWALARLLLELAFNGIPSPKVAHALITLKFCAGTHAPVHVQRCERRMRTIRSRYVRRMQSRAANSA